VRKSAQLLKTFSLELELAVSVVWPRCLFEFAGGHSNTQVGPDPLNLSKPWGSMVGIQGNVMTVSVSLPVAPHPLPRFSYCGCGWSGLRFYNHLRVKNISYCKLTKPKRYILSDYGVCCVSTDVYKVEVFFNCT